jgi:hypothetical protein
MSGMEWRCGTFIALFISAFDPLLSNVGVFLYYLVFLVFGS